MERMTLEKKVTEIVMRIGKPKAINWLKENYGVANFSRLNNAGLAAFIEYFTENA